MTNRPLLRGGITEYGDDSPGFWGRMADFFLRTGIAAAEALPTVIPQVLSQQNQARSGQQVHIPEMTTPTLGGAKFQHNAQKYLFTPDTQVFRQTPSNFSGMSSAVNRFMKPFSSTFGSQPGGTPVNPARAFYVGTGRHEHSFADVSP